MFEDLSYGLRTMARNRGVTVTALITLALGIGANTAMFSIVNAVLLRPLPYRDPGRLVTIRAQIPHLNIYGAFVEYNTFGEWWRARNRSFQAMTAFSPGSANLNLGDEPERVFTTRVNAGFFALLGTRPALGREFLPEEDQPGAPRVAMVSDSLWKRRFGADPTFIGRQIVLDRTSYTVVGVLPAGFDLLGPDMAVYMPLAVSTARAPGMPTVGVYARLKPDVPLRTAQADIDELCRGWVQQYHYPNDWGARVWTLRDFMVRDVRSTVVMLAVAVALVLLIACANVANLLLARAGARQREMAIRNTLGAGNWRIIRQLLTESALLGSLAGVLGLFAAWAGVRALAAAPAYLPFQKSVSIDMPVLLFTLVAALATTLLFGLAPALSAAHGRLAENLKESGRGGGEGLGRSRLRAALAIAEVALSLLLAIGATLTARSLMRLQTVNPGFNPEGVVRGYLTLPSASYAAPAQRVNFVKALVNRLKNIPGAAATGMVSHLPFSNSKSGSSIDVEGAPPPRPGERIIVFGRVADPGYLEAMQVRLLRGRFFDDRDPPGQPVAIVNETMARRCWPGQNPVGKRFGGGPDHWITVVGVIADLRQTSLAEEPDAESYVPYAQQPGATMALVVRSNQDPLRLAPAIRAAVRELDKDLPVSQMAPLADNLSASTRSRRFSVALLGSFTALALILATVGIYGVIAYSVTRRTHEIGVRLALGAERGRIERMVVGRALLLGGIGVAIGVAGGLALTRLLRSMLYGVSATDPLVFAGASLLLLMVAALAGYAPARRAARVDPCIALREE